MTVGSGKQARGERIRYARHFLNILLFLSLLLVVYSTTHKIKCPGSILGLVDSLMLPPPLPSTKSSVSARFPTSLATPTPIDNPFRHDKEGCVPPCHVDIPTWTVGLQPPLPPQRTDKGHNKGEFPPLSCHIHFSVTRVFTPRRIPSISMRRGGESLVVSYSFCLDSVKSCI